MSAAQAGAAAGSAAIRELGVTDALDLLVRGLAPDAKYTLAVAPGDAASGAGAQPLATFQTNAKGGGQAQALGPIRRIVSPAGSPAPAPRSLIVTREGDSAVVLSGKVAP